MELQTDNLLSQNQKVYDMIKVGISKSDFCVNIKCNKPLTQYEKDRQDGRHTKHFFCQRCRNLGVPKSKPTTVLCAKCRNPKDLVGALSSFICQNCLIRKPKKILGGITT